MPPSKAFTVCWSVVLLVLAGCEAFIPVPAPPPKMKAPFAYEPLAVRNSCFVEAVHFYDTYLARRPAGDQSWVRVLQWGHRDGDFTVSSGHAIAVFVANGALCAYDINFGFWSVGVGVDRRADLSDVGPRVFSHYPQFKPVFARYRDDYFQRPPPARPDFLFYHANADVRDATRVANELGRYRPVNVVEFSYTASGQKYSSAAAMFVFGGRLCVYLPQGGTHVSNLLSRDVNDLRGARIAIGKFFPGVSDVRPQAGGYLLFPPKS